jgi:hypothetical protein
MLAPLLIERIQIITVASIIRGTIMITNQTSGINLGVGSIAFLAGVFATIVTAYAMVSKKNRTVQKLQDHYEGWEEGLGV